MKRIFILLLFFASLHPIGDAKAETKVLSWANVKVESMSAQKHLFNAKKLLKNYDKKLTKGMELYPLAKAVSHLKAIPKSDPLYDEAQKIIEECASIAEKIEAAPTGSTNGISMQSDSNWLYESSSDEMSSKNIYFAGIISGNTVDFGFPYNGEQHATLTLRTHPRSGKNIYISLNKAHFLCRSYDGCNVLVRFDENEPITFSASGTSDYSTNTLFINNYSRFISKLSKAKKLRISAEFYQNGTKTFEFDIAGFNQDAYLNKRKTD